jgi:hypothetical protein
LQDRSLWKRHKLVLVTTSHLYNKEAKDSKSPLFGPHRERKPVDEDVALAESPDLMVQEVFASGDGQTGVEGLGSVDDEISAPSIPSPKPALPVPSPSLAFSLPNLSVPLSLAAKLGNNAAVVSAGVIMGAVATAASSAAASIGKTTEDADPAAPVPAPSAAAEAKPTTCPSEVRGGLLISWFSLEFRLFSSIKPIFSPQWFVCDSKDGKVRYFVIQGSDSVASWKTNLQFDPCTFENPELGLRVHRGFYKYVATHECFSLEFWLFSSIKPIRDDESPELGTSTWRTSHIVVFTHIVLFTWSFGCFRL